MNLPDNSNSESGTPSSKTSNPAQVDGQEPDPTSPLSDGPKRRQSDLATSAESLPDPTALGLPPAPDIDEVEAEELLGDRLKTLLVGRPRDLSASGVFQHLSLVAFLAWVGLGADGLSSSAYGPAEAFKFLQHGGDHTYLAVFLAAATILTVFIISSCYSHIIEEFPSGGGGYLVATKLLGQRLGLLSGCALLVDYVLTITVSIAAAGDALFGLVDAETAKNWKLFAEFGAIILLILLNLRGVRESVIALTPIFLLFLVTHAAVILGAIVLNSGAFGEVGHFVREGLHEGLNDPQLGILGLMSLFLYAYSLGAGTYTGIEAVSNSMQVMAEPRVATGKRTMLYMACSLALTAGGLILAYLLLGIRHTEEQTMNTILTERFLVELGLNDGIWGTLFLWATILSEGALLLVAAQAGYIGGPRMLANMAQDSWVPHWFANLSERLTTHNGIFLMGFSALAALAYTGGDVSALLIMYSINVFLTFSLSMVGMCAYWRKRKRHPLWRRRLALFGVGAGLCLTILVITVYEKFFAGGWITLAVTGACVGLCLLISRYYDGVRHRLQALDETLGRLTTPTGPPNLYDPDPKQATAAVLVGGFSGLGIHTLLNAVRFAPGHFRNLIFLSVGVVDTGNFKGEGAVEDLKKHTADSLEQYVDLAQRLGMPSISYMAIGTDGVEELEHLCLTVARKFPKAIFFAGQLVFQRDTWYQRLLHNQTAFALQRRLQWAGVSMVILPTRVR